MLVCRVTESVSNMRYFVCLSAQRVDYFDGGNCLTSMVIDYPNPKIKDADDVKALEKAATDFFFTKNDPSEYRSTIMLSFQKLDDE